MRRLELHHTILLAMLLGAGIGLPLNALAEAGHLAVEVPRTAAAIGREAGDLFLRLLQMLVVPLILASLVTGVTGIESMRGLGRMSARTFAFYVLSSLAAIGTGLLFVNLLSPGQGTELGLLAREGEPVVPAIVEGGESVGVILYRQLTSMIPRNPFAAIAAGDMLPIIFFALLFGIFVRRAENEASALLSRLFAALFDVMMKMTLFVLRLAPIGVFGFMLYAAAGRGLSVFVALGMYMLTVALALLVHATVTLPLALRFLARRSPWAYAKALAPALLTAFSTASSNGALPLTLTCVEKRAGIDNRVGSFVLPLGATINMDGTALYEAVAVLFLAQVYGADLGFGQQAVVAFTALLASIGAAGIPHAGTVMMVVVLSAVGLPVEGVGLILAVDRILDMARTTVNVWSDATATAVVAAGLSMDAGETSSP